MGAEQLSGGDHLAEDSIGLYRPIPIEPEHGLLIVFNPTSKSSIEHADYLTKKAVYDWPGGGPIIKLATQKTVEDNVEQLKTVQSRGPLHQAILGGDGTHAMMLKATINSGFKGINAISANGNACDLAHSINIDSYALDPIGSIKHGMASTIRPIDIEITNQQGELVKKTSAIGYAGVGFTGDLSQLFNTPAYRRQAQIFSSKPVRYASEFKKTIEYVDSAEPFMIDDHDHEPRLAIEYMVMNGGRVAKTRFLPYNRIFKPQATIAEVRSAKRSDIFKAVAKLMLGGQTMHTNECVAITVNYDHDNPLLMQTDGEIMIIPSGSTISYRISKDKVRVAKTRS